MIFFFALAGASAGYLTVGEVFPLEVGAKAIAVFFAIARCFGYLGTHGYGHLIGTHPYGHLIGTGKDPGSLYAGYLIGAGAMILGGVVAAFLGLAAEGKSLEDVATPLSAVREPSMRPPGAGTAAARDRLDRMRPVGDAAPAEQATIRSPSTTSGRILTGQKHNDGFSALLIMCK